MEKMEVMMNKETIIKAGSAVNEDGSPRYLSDIEEFTDLPDNCHFNKVLTGCGGTTVALSNKVKYVIAAPTKGIGENKQKWADEYKVNICIIDGDSLDEDGEKGKDARIKKVIEYIKAGGIKIVVTYDSLPSVVKALGESVNEWKLLVDESHMLLEAGSFRYGSVYSVIESMNKFKSYCLMTATPVKDAYQLPNLKNIPKINVEWDNIEAVNIERRTTEKKISDYAALLVLEYLNGELGKTNNAHIFLNSVISITDIMRKVKQAYKGVDLEKQVKIVCAQRSENRAKIKQYLGTKYQIGFTTDIAKKVNSYTSTAFSGQDIFDKYALSYVIIDGRKDYSKVDITTTIPQIIGRVRDANIKNKLVMMYSADEFNKYLNIDTYEKQILGELSKAKDVVSDYKIVSEATKEKLKNDSKTDEYLFYNKENDELIVNDIAQLSKLNAFETQHTVYRVAKGSESKSHTHTINSIEYRYEGIPLPDLEGIEKLALAQKPDFKALCLDYIDYKEREINAFLFETAMPDATDGDTLDIIQQAYEKLGVKKIKALDYRKQAIKDELVISNKKSTHHHQVRSMLGFRLADKVSSKQVRDKIIKVYDELGIEGNPTAKDIEKYYCVEYKLIPNAKTGRRERGIVIGAPKALDSR